MDGDALGVLRVDGHLPGDHAAEVGVVGPCTPTVPTGWRSRQAATPGSAGRPTASSSPSSGRRPETSSSCDRTARVSSASSTSRVPTTSSALAARDGIDRDQLAGLSAGSHSAAPQGTFANCECVGVPSGAFVRLVSVLFGRDSIRE